MERNEAAIKRLAETMRKDPPLALVGAGVSVGAGYPTWNGLLNLLHKKLLEMPEAAASPKYISQLKRMDDPLWRAEEYRRLIGVPGFHSVIWETFKPKSKPPGGTTKELAKLNFRHFMTTNYDTSLEDTYRTSNSQPINVVEWTEREKLGNFLRDVSKQGASRHFVYLHGRYSDPSNIVLTERDYVRRYVSTDDASKKLFAVFMMQPVVFIGFSLSDPDLTYLLRVANAHVGLSTPQHYVILPSGGDEDYQAATASYLINKYGIEPIFYPLTKDHSKLTSLLQQIHQAKSEKQLQYFEWTPEKSKQGKGSSKKPKIDPDDPQKGQWGGLSQSNGRRLTAKVTPTDDSDWFAFRLTVKSTNRKNPLKGPVTFHLHPTFIPDKVTVESERGEARYEDEAYGAFTVGAEADKGKTRLELDLGTIKDAPAIFRLR